jgi:hypothetical protein
MNMNTLTTSQQEFREDLQENMVWLEQNIVYVDEDMKKTALSLVSYYDRFDMLTLKQLILAEKIVVAARRKSERLNCERFSS